MRRTALMFALAGMVGALVATPIVVYATHQFTDVSDSAFFSNSVTWMKDNGITVGCNPPSNTKYCPGDNVTRGEMAVFLKRLSEKKVVDAATAVTADHATAADFANTAGDADKVDGMDASDLVPAHDAPVLVGDTNNAFTAVNGVTNLHEISITAPSDGFLYMSVNSSWASSSPLPMHILIWIQLDNSACSNTSENVISVAFGYALSTDVAESVSKSFAGTAAISQGAHKVALCARPFGGNLTPSFYAAAIQALYVANGSVSASTAGGELIDLPGTSG